MPFLSVFLPLLVLLSVDLSVPFLPLGLFGVGDGSVGPGWPGVDGVEGGAGAGAWAKARVPKQSVNIADAIGNFMEPL